MLQNRGVVTSLAVVLFLVSSGFGQAQDVVIEMPGSRLIVRHSDGVAAPPADFGVFRKFDSGTRALGFFGARWISNLENRLVAAPDGESVKVQINGEVANLKRKGEEWQAPAYPGITARRTPPGWQVRIGTRETYSFDSSGVFQSWEGPAGARFKASYDEGVYPTSLEDHQGKTWKVRWSKERLITEIFSTGKNAAKYEYKYTGNRLDRVLYNGKALYSYVYLKDCFYCLVSLQGPTEDIRSVTYRHMGRGEVSSVDFPSGRKLSGIEGSRDQSREGGNLVAKWQENGNQFKAQARYGPPATERRLASDQGSAPDLVLKELELAFGKSHKRWFFGQSPNEVAKVMSGDKVIYVHEMVNHHPDGSGMSKVAKDGYSFSVSYGSGGRIEKIVGVNQQGQVAFQSIFQYSKEGQLVAVQDGQRRAEITYDKKKRISKMMLFKSGLRAPAAAVGDVRLQYTPGGRLTKVTGVKVAPIFQGKPSAKALAQARAIVRFIRSPIDRLSPPS